ncbi:MAG: hypothetical protein ISR47_00910 [Rhodospirillales bacterium]|nr:hypothetical protein [Rhodospirillales bacterium]
MTEHVFDLSDLTQNQWSIHNYLLETELSGNAAKAYELSHARLGKSGYSIGHSQVDISEHPKLAEKIGKLLNDEGLPADDISNIVTALKSKEVNATVTANLSKINAALQTTAGYTLVDDIHKANLGVVAGRTI